MVWEIRRMTTLKAIIKDRVEKRQQLPSKMCAVDGAGSGLRGKGGRGPEGNIHFSHARIATGIRQQMRISVRRSADGTELKKKKIIENPCRHIVAKSKQIFPWEKKNKIK